MKVEQLASLGEIVKFAPSEVICHQNRTKGKMYIILSGKIGIYHEDSMEKIKVGRLEAGDFFGELTIIDEAPIDFTAKAESSTVLLVIPSRNHKKLLNTVPDLAYNIVLSLGKRIRSLENNFSNLKAKFPDQLKDHLSNREILKNVFLKQVEKKNGLKSDTLTLERMEQNGLTIFPKNHGLYSLQAKPSDENYYYTKEVDCPICKNNFTTKIPRMTKLRLIRRESDLREIFKDFDPLWYSIRTCPFCLFAMRHDNFEKIGRLRKASLKHYQEKALELVGKFNLSRGEPLTINRVFADYYLAIFFAELEDSPLLNAKLYMSLSWLYKDVEDLELYEYAWNKAFKYYYQVYYETNLSGFSPSHEQQLCIILGELYYRKGEKTEALKHFYAAIRQQDGISYYNNLARDRYMEIKEESAN